MNKPACLFLCDESGIMARPWLEAGYPCIIVDAKHEPGAHTEGLLTKVGADILHYLPPRTSYAFAAAFPPCTDLAVSGAQYFQDKGLAALASALALVNRSREILEWTGAPWMIENPVGTLSTYWRTPDYSFDPCDFGGYLTPPGDAYTKKTCLWTGGGFAMPWPKPVAPQRVNSQGSWLMSLGGRSERTKALRSKTPEGFARAVFSTNQPMKEAVNA
jgi:hypothetical protein